MTIGQMTLAVLLVASSLDAQERSELAGVPTLKVDEGVTERSEVTLAADAALNLRCLIVENNGKYFWASRGNVEMLRLVDTFGLVTYVAVDASGYVRLLTPAIKARYAPTSRRYRDFDYAEQVFAGLGSVTYFGRRFK